MQYAHGLFQIIQFYVLSYQINTKILNVPHSGISERIFVLKPWADLAPNYIIPKYDLSVKELFLKLNYSDDLKVVGKTEKVI